MSRVSLIIGMIWAAPVSLLAFIFYVAPLWALGVYSYSGWDEIAFVWHVFEYPIAEGWIAMRVQALWTKWAGSTLGNIIVVSVRKNQPGSEGYERTMVHEKHHVRQIMRAGIFQPIIYCLFWVVIKLFMPRSDPYYDNPWEIDARRQAGQLIDVVGVARKLKG